MLVCLHLSRAEKFAKVSITSEWFIFSEEELYFILIDIMRSPETLK